MLSEFHRADHGAQYTGHVYSARMCAEAIASEGFVALGLLTPSNKASRNRTGRAAFDGVSSQ